MHKLTLSLFFLLFLSCLQPQNQLARVESAEFIVPLELHQVVAFSPLNPPVGDPGRNFTNWETCCFMRNYPTPSTQISIEFDISAVGEFTSAILSFHIFTADDKKVFPIEFINGLSGPDEPLINELFQFDQDSDGDIDLEDFAITTNHRTDIGIYFYQGNGEMDNEDFGLGESLIVIEGPTGFIDVQNQDFCDRIPGYIIDITDQLIAAKNEGWQYLGFNFRSSNFNHRFVMAVYPPDIEWCKEENDIVILVQ